TQSRKRLAGETQLYQSIDVFVDGQITDLGFEKIAEIFLSWGPQKPRLRQSQNTRGHSYQVMPKRTAGAMGAHNKDWGKHAVETVELLRSLFGCSCFGTVRKPVFAFVRML